MYGGGGGNDGDGTESVVSVPSSIMSTSTSLVAGVSAMTFDQHSTMIRY